MADRCVVIGAGGQARVVLSLLRTSASDRYSPQFAIDLRYQGASETILDYPVCGMPRSLDEWRQDNIGTVFLALGENATRHSYFDLFLREGFLLPNLIARSAYVDSTASLGVANVICQNAHLGPCARIGNNNIINTAANVEHESNIGDHCHVGPGTMVCGRVTVGSGCFLGAGSIIIPQRRVADWVTVGAGAVVTKDITASGSQHVGVPARVLVP